MIKYLQLVRGLAAKFDAFEMCHIPQEENSRVDALSRLASSSDHLNTRSVLLEELDRPSYKEPPVLTILQQDDWRAPYVRWLTEGVTPEDPREAR